MSVFVSRARSRGVIIAGTVKNPPNYVSQTMGRIVDLEPSTDASNVTINVRIGSENMSWLNNPRSEVKS